MALFGYTVDGLIIPFATYNVGDGDIPNNSTNTYNYDLFEKGLNPFQLIFQNVMQIGEDAFKHAVFLMNVKINL